MKREEYKSILLSKGFKFEKTQMGFPGRGEQDVFTHPNFKNKFYITRVHKDDKSLYGFLTTKTNGAHLEHLYPHNAEDTFAKDRGLPVWVDNAFVELTDKLRRI